MDTVAIVVGALLCWRAPMPDLVNRTELPVTVIELKTLPTGEEGAWVQTTGGKLAGQQWHVARADLRECKGQPVVLSK
jgi:hypothetical protein